MFDFGFVEVGCDQTKGVMLRLSKYERKGLMKRFIRAFPADRSGPRFSLILHEALTTMAGIRCNR